MCDGVVCSNGVVHDHEAQVKKEGRIRQDSWRRLIALGNECRNKEHLKTSKPTSPKEDLGVCASVVTEFKRKDVEEVVDKD